METLDNDLPIFRTLSGTRVDLSGPLLLTHSYTMQRYRDVWSVVTQFPYLVIDDAKVNVYSQALTAFPVFIFGLLYQNVSPEDFVQRVTGNLASPAITAGFSQTSGTLVEGRANPRAHGIMTFNDPLYIGMHSYCALGTKYVYVETDHIYQHTIATLIVVDKHSRPRSTIVDFDRLADLQHDLFTRYLSQTPGKDLADTKDLEHLLDAIFVENEKILAAADDHHSSLAPYTTEYDYEAPVLTKYGRLTHDRAGKPQIEISFALLHYEKALREFDAMKKATSSTNVDETFSCGVSCVVAAAACIEAIANKLVFLSTSSHPNYRDVRQPLLKINESCSMLAAQSGTTFSPLQPGDAEYDALDELRVHRNSFMHAKELETEIEPTTRQSVKVVEIDETKCRTYLMQLRLGVQKIFSQLPDIRPPIETRRNVTWLGVIEVP